MAGHEYRFTMSLVLPAAKVAGEVGCCDGWHSRYLRKPRESYNRYTRSYPPPPRPASASRGITACRDGRRGILILRCTANNAFAHNTEQWKKDLAGDLYVTNGGI
jgi:hypothetical protein